MRTLLSVGLLAVFSVTGVWAQPERVFGWVRASDEVIQLDPMDFHAGRVYRPGPDGGNMHVIIHSKQPITVMMASAREWSEAQLHPVNLGSLDYGCVREHVLDTTYECHLPPSHPMVLVLRDERTADRAIVQGIGAIVGKAGARKLIAPNDVLITYHSWSCVQNCVQPEYRWTLLAKEKYDVSGAPKLYSVAPEYDGQRIWVKIKAQVPITLAILPSKAADEAYGKPELLSSALSQTACKQRGVQSMEFECKMNVADGPQSLMALSEAPVRSHKKAEIEFQTLKCIANCELIGSETAANK